MPWSPLHDVLPLVGAPGPSADSVRYRTVTATGHFDDAHTVRVGLRTVDGADGDLVLTPFVTSGGDVLVVRGLDADRSGSTPAPPAGQVTIRARVQTSEPNRDSAAAFARGKLRRSMPRHRRRTSARPCTTAMSNCCPASRARRM